MRMPEGPQLIRSNHPSCESTTSLAEIHASSPPRPKWNQEAKNSCLPCLSLDCEGSLKERATQFKRGGRSPYPLGRDSVSICAA